MAIESFKPGSAAEPDGLRPGHLKQLVSKSVGETGNWFLGTLAVFVNLVLSGNVPEHIKHTFYGANLRALNKDGRGIRPIDVRNTLRRLAAKVGQKPIAHGLGNHSRPTQMGFETKRCLLSGSSCSPTVLEWNHTSTGATEVRCLQRVQLYA